ncbi:MAG: ComEC/Rec2 family competence protein [Bradymonadales bacterium]|nr:MAG: ComEC/Rec2 family competence protein [Bradymonadales bacterium]
MDRFFFLWLSFSLGIFSFFYRPGLWFCLVLALIFLIKPRLRWVLCLSFVAGALFGVFKNQTDIKALSGLQALRHKEELWSFEVVEHRRFDSRVRLRAVNHQALGVRAFALVSGHPDFDFEYERLARLVPTASFELPFNSLERIRTQRKMLGRLRLSKSEDSFRVRFGSDEEEGWIARFRALFLRGESASLGRELWRSLHRLGLSHLFVISGLHVGLFSFALWFILKWGLSLAFKSEFLWPLRIGFVLALTFLWFWFPPGVSINRAILCASIFLFGPILWKDSIRYPPSDLLALLGLGTLIVQPDYFWRPGYWFSFGACWILLRSELSGRDFSTWALASLQTSLGVFLLSHSMGNEIHWISSFLNLIFVSFFFIIFLPVQALALFGFQWVESFNQRFVEGLMQLDSSFSKVVGLSPYMGMFAIFLLCALIFLLIQPASLRRMRWAFVLLTPVLFGALSQISFSKGAVEGLQVEMWDVGQGDAFFIQMEDKRILIDGGLGERMRDWLRQRRIQSLDLWVLSHFDLDHAGAFEALADRIRFEELWIPRQDESEFFAKNLRDRFLGKLVAIQDSSGEICSQNFCFGAFSQISRSPRDGVLPPVRNSDSILNYLYQRKDRQLLAVFLGDVGRLGERRLLNWLQSRQIEIPSAGLGLLKIAHHGSNTSTGPQLLERLRPQKVWISCGRQNQYAFPHPSVLDRLRSSGSTIRRLDAVGGQKWRNDAGPSR